MKSILGAIQRPSPAPAKPAESAAPPPAPRSILAAGVLGPRSKPAQ